MKRIIRLTESDLHNIVKESVKRLVKEGIYGDKVRRAFRDAKDLKDFDHMRQDAEIEGEDLGELGQIEHPQSNSNFYSHEYANGNLDLDDLEGDVRWHKEELYPENRVISKAINHVLEGRNGRIRHAMDINQKNMERMYNEIINTGYSIVPNVKRGVIMSDGKVKIYNMPSSGINPLWDYERINRFKKFISEQHPEKLVKTALVPRKKERGQLDDEIFFDVKVYLVDNTTGAPQTKETTATIKAPNINKKPRKPSKKVKKQGEAMPKSANAINFSSKDIEGVNDYA